VDRGSTIWFIDLGMGGGTTGLDMAVTDHHCQRREELTASYLLIEEDNSTGSSPRNGRYGREE
jgi:hypothetical protein